MLSFFYIHRAYCKLLFLRASEVNEGQSEVSYLTSHLSGHIFIPAQPIKQKAIKSPCTGSEKMFFFPKNFQLWGGFNCTENASQTVHKHYFEDFESLLLRYVNAEWVGGDCEKSQLSIGRSDTLSKLIKLIM